jgi:hypothetical protein
MAIFDPAERHKTSLEGSLLPLAVVAGTGRDERVFRLRRYSLPWLEPFMACLWCMAFRLRHLSRDDQQGPAKPGKVWTQSRGR